MEPRLNAGLTCSKKIAEFNDSLKHHNRTIIRRLSTKPDRDVWSGLPVLFNEGNQALPELLCINQSIISLEMLIFDGISGRLFTSYHPASEISFPSTDISPLSYSAVKPIIKELGNGHGILLDITFF